MIRVIIFIALYSLLPRILYSQKIQYKDLIGTWNGYWEVKDSTNPSTPGSLEFTDSAQATWRLWNNELSKFTYKLIFSKRGFPGITSPNITLLSMSGLNYQNQYVNTFAVLTKYGNDTLRIQWLSNPDKPVAEGDTAKFHNTVILVRGKH
ncbi:MAG TPA: hypothetical protein VNV85_02415 [Puia sp.]|jgi:hypothetical protein|nr:hypothetical protein [Puia sp.]